jgi:hypothetical protein
MLVIEGVIMKGAQTYRVCPDENNANEDGEEHPSGPKFGIESVEQIGSGGCSDGHRRREFVLSDIKAIIPGGRREIRIENDEEYDG